MNNQCHHIHNDLSLFDMQNLHHYSTLLCNHWAPQYKEIHYQGTHFYIHKHELHMYHLLFHIQPCCFYILHLNDKILACSYNPYLGNDILAKQWNDIFSKNIDLTSTPTFTISSSFITILSLCVFLFWFR